MLALVGPVLGGHAYVSRAGEQVILADGAEFEYAMGAYLGARAYLDILANYGEGPDLYVGVYPGLGMYYRCGMYLGRHVVLQ